MEPSPVQRHHEQYGGPHSGSADDLHRGQPSDAHDEPVEEPVEEFHDELIDETADEPQLEPEVDQLDPRIDKRMAHIGKRKRQILKFIDETQRERGYPPSVREIGEEVKLRSPATVHRHLRNLEADGWLKRDPSRPRALIVTFDWQTGVRGERRPTRHVPLIGDVAAGTDVLAQQNVEELLPLPADFTGDGELFMLRVRGDSMVEAGIMDRDYVVARHQSKAENGDIVVAGIDGEEGTVKRLKLTGTEVVLEPANSSYPPIIRPTSEITIYGRVVTVIRRL